MKRIVTTVGVAALGVAVIQNSNAQDGAKAWTASAALRGFYDDNIGTVHNNKTESFGFSVSPSLAYELPLEQTSLSFIYTYAFLYFDKAHPGFEGHDSQTHTIAASLTHSFNERTTASLRDSFVVGQEPDQLGGAEAVATPQRLNGNNIRNYAAAQVNHQITRLLGVEVGYNNSLFDYDNHASGTNYFHTATKAGTTNASTALLGNRSSYSGQLDRMEHSVHVDARWTLSQSTVALVGYQFGLGCYTGDEVVGGLNSTNSNVSDIVIRSSNRDYRSHYGYVGLEHVFGPDLTGSVRGGVRYTDHYRALEDDSQVAPYVQARLQYTYAKDCNLAVGVTHDRSATDSFTIKGSSITTDSDTTVAFASLTHAITPNLSGSLIGTFQDNNFNGGTLDGDSEQFYTVGVSLSYQITRNIAATASYNYDHLASDQVLRSYDRNRVFIGATFTY